MTMTAAFLDSTDVPANVERRDRRDATPLGHDLRDLLAKKGDHLLRDAGLTRAGVLGPEEAFRAEWRPQRELWNL